MCFGARTMLLVRAVAHFAAVNWSRLHSRGPTTPFGCVLIWFLNLTSVGPSYPPPTSRQCLRGYREVLYREIGVLFEQPPRDEARG